jgi:excisionase family DNA binding protein
MSPMSDKQNLATPVSASEAAGLLTKEELAGVLKCSERQIERLQVARKIPFVKLSGRMIRYRRESVLRALVKMETEAIG